METNKLKTITNDNKFVRASVFKNEFGCSVALSLGYLSLDKELKKNVIVNKNITIMEKELVAVLEVLEDAREEICAYLNDKAVEVAQKEEVISSLNEDDYPIAMAEGIKYKPRDRDETIWGDDEPIKKFICKDKKIDDSSLTFSAGW